MSTTNLELRRQTYGNTRRNASTCDMSMPDRSGKEGEMTKDENNRIIAEWLFDYAPIDFTPNPASLWGTTISDVMREAGFTHTLNGKAVRVPDFYLDEAANALVLEKFYSLGYSIHVFPMLTGGGVLADLFKHFSTHRELVWSSNKTDRKTAIVEAALKFIQESKKGES